MVAKVAAYATLGLFGALVAACGGGSGTGSDADLGRAPVIASANEGDPAPISPASGGGDAASGSGVSVALPGATSDAPRPIPTSRVRIAPAITASAVPATPTAAPVARDADELIAAAKATYEAGRGATSVAWDYAGATVVAHNRVRLTVCAWGGDTAFDQLLDLTYRVETDPGTDELSATYRDVLPADGECLNSSLVRSAFDFVGVHDQWLSAVLAAPADFDRGRASPLVTGPYLELVAAGAQALADAGTRREGGGFVGNLPSSAVREILWRRYETSAGPVLAIMACRDMNPRSGLYDEDGLVDDGHTEGGTRGPHSVIEYRLIRSGGGWKMDQVDSTVWANCFIGDDWAAAVNAAAPSGAPWRSVGN